MLIKKIFNNNTVLFQSENGEDRIALGKGIAFSKKIGDSINEEKVDKIFIPDSSINEFSRLLQNIPYEYFVIGDEIFKYMKLELAKPLEYRTYFLLVDHIYAACERAKEGIYLKSTMYWDVKRFYKAEFKIAEFALKTIEEKLSIKLDRDEASFIALNIVNSTNSSTEKHSSDSYEITKIMHEIINIIRREFLVELDEDSVDYYRFINHLKYFANRIVSDGTYDSKEDDLLPIIKNKYRNSYSVTEKIVEFIKKNYGQELSDEEKLYLTIHIERIIYRREE